MRNKKLFKRREKLEEKRKALDLQVFLLGCKIIDIVNGCKHYSYDMSAFEEYCDCYEGNDFDRSICGSCNCYEPKEKKAERDTDIGKNREEEMKAPHGRCEKCNEPLVAELDGCDADGNRGRWLYYCRNPECEEADK